MKLRGIARKAQFLFAVLTIVNIPLVMAQSGTSSALAGSVLDKSGAAIPHAQVRATDLNTGAIRTAESNADGRFIFSQVNPGTYRIEIRAQGFGPGQSLPARVSVGETATVNFILSPAAALQTVEVTAQSGLMSLENPNTSTTLEAKTIKNLPNPGQDLTYLAQFAQGALMNTAGSSNDAKAAGGYGNVEFNGLPATSNGYILDGYDTNDPWLGLNIGLSTNLVIGLDAVQEATVNTNSFSVDQGRYAVAQVNYFTKSGTNAFHGDVYEIWNGSLFNAENYFLHANDTAGNIAKKPRSTVNEFGVSVGGPIRRNKLFFFGHYEGIRIALPLVSQMTLPTPAYQQYVLGQLAIGGTDPGYGHWSSGAARGDPVLPQDVLLAACAGRLTGADRRLPSRHERRRLRQPASGIAQQQRQREPDRGEDRPHHQRERQRLVSLSAGHRTAGGLYRSHQSDLQLLFAAAAAHAGDWLHAYVQPDAREPVQSRRELVFEHLRAEQLSLRCSRHFPSCWHPAATACRSPPSAVTTIPIRRAARSRSGRSTTT